MALSYIRFNILRVLPEYLQKTINFYTNICGMKYSMETVTKEDYPYDWKDNILHIFAYDKKSEDCEPTGVCFLVDDNHKSTYKNSGYWKIGISLRDVDAAVDSFIHHGQQNMEYGGQLVDVGFLTQAVDPNGYSIELLQHDFEENFIKPSDNQGILSQPSEHPPCIGQITIRCTDAKRTCEFYQNILGMKLMCVEQPANTFPFTLYFFAYTEDNPPSDNLSDVLNREWLYKKEYCQIEIQHRHNLADDFTYCTNDDNNANIKIGHLGYCVQVIPRIMDGIKANIKDVKITRNASGKEQCFIRDPDGYVIQVIT